MARAEPPIFTNNPDEIIRLLEQELAETNREVLALTLELDRRIEELRAAEQRYRRLAENAPDVMFRYELHPRRIFTFVNPRITALTGYQQQEFYAGGEVGLNIVHPEDRPLLEASFQEDCPEVSLLTLRWVHKKGNIIWIEQHQLAVRDQDGRFVAVECIARDITDRKHLEDQLRQSQKMEAIGRLAGGIAHDFNNLLTVINGYSARVQEELEADDPLHDDIDQIYRAGERAASLTQQLLAFSRRQVVRPRPIDLNVVVSTMGRMLRRILGEDVELVTTLAPSLDSVFGDPGQMEQVIMNLAVNARDAMKTGGRLLIETRNVELDASSFQHHGFLPGQYVMLSVSDSGCGMDEETQALIFEPFFTTKPVGQGTGLGLSTVLGIVQQSGGTIRVRSEPGGGTTFKLYFPKVAAASEPVEPRITGRPVAGSESVLVVEDDDAVREFIRLVLEPAGYTVLEARSGGAALDLSEAHAGAIDLAITDVVMPQMSGQELATRLSQSRPHIQLLFMSGFTDNLIVHQAALDPRMSFLQKPFTPAALKEKVREALDKVSSPE